MAPVIPPIPVDTPLYKVNLRLLPSRSRVSSLPLEARGDHVTCLGQRDISKCDVSRDLTALEQAGACPLAGGHPSTTMFSSLG